MVSEVSFEVYLVRYCVKEDHISYHRVILSSGSGIALIIDCPSLASILQLLELTVAR